LGELVGEGSLLALGDSKGLFAQRNGNGDIRVYVALCTASAKDALALIDNHHPRHTRRQLLQSFDGWNSNVVDLLRLSEDSFVARPLYALPSRQQWTPFAGITLLGDAAHVMPPFTGQGANLAMLDALELAQCLSDDTHATLPEAIMCFERHMLERMAPAIAETLASQAMMMSPDAPGSLLAEISRRLADASP
jgi:2-polyprenyl-6-methoxyphenol hydroxylase-like FAD-dependent oxidoreductase